MEKTIRWLFSHPDEDILKYKKVRDFLETQKVYISLTTSPTRISKLRNVIRTLNLQHVEKIILNIPHYYSRDKSTYEIPEYLKNHRKVVINRIEEDVGPLSKIVPGIEYVRENRPAHLVAKDIVISVDDDTGYGWAMVGQYIKLIAVNGYDVVAASAEPLTRPCWHIENDEAWPMKSNTLIVEGFAGIGYRVGAINTETMRAIVAKEKELGAGKNCFNSDDMVISYSLALEGIDRFHVDNRYYNADMLRQFPYGMEADALHRGAGDTGLAKEASVANINANEVKYKRCYNFMTTHFPARVH
jgi:hypothetical protein